MQRNTALPDFFATGNFSATQAAAHFYFNTLSTHTKCRSDRHFNSPFKINTVFNLPGYGVGYNICIQLRATYFKNINLNVFFAGQLLQFFLDSINLTATFTDNYTWLGCMDSDD